MGGCCSSEVETSRHPNRAVNIGPPQDLMLNIPRPRLGETGMRVRVFDHELDKQTIEIALGYVAEYLRSKNEQLTIVTVGGAVNTLFLQSRQSTHDVDFLGTNLDNRQQGLLDEAAQYAESQSRVPLAGEWFNNQTALWLPIDVHRELTRVALEQNAIVFEERGLKVVAAPWSYAFCTKADRLSRDNARPYDLADAPSYLRFYIDAHGH
jgi:hypothetical protein